jgi:hypothetical protein
MVLAYGIGLGLVQTPDVLGGSAISCLAPMVG